MKKNNYLNVSDELFKERKRKWSDSEESWGINSKRKNEDIKPNIEMICKNIKKEPDFLANKIKKELDIEVKKIKKEPCESDTELVTSTFTELKLKSRKKRKVTRTCKKVRKKSKKTTAKIKKSTQTKKTKSRKKSLTSKKSSRKRKTKTGKKNKSVKYSNSKKEAKTLLDQQSKTDLRLFGFRDELEYFSSEPDNEGYKETNLGSCGIGKRTSLSSLEARKKVLLALKSTPTHPSPKTKPVIQPCESKNFDLLGSLLESQSLWHSKNSHMKVNEDGSVEVTSSRNKSMETELTKIKKIKVGKNETKANIKEDKKKLEPTQAGKNTGHTQSTAIESVLHGSLNLSKNTEAPLKVKIKSEPIDLAETWDMKTEIDMNKEQAYKAKIKIEIKEEKDPPTSNPSSFLS